MSSLNNVSRLILRSRVRRHPDSANVLKGAGVSTLSNADLIQCAALLGLDVPNEHECAAYTNAKASNNPNPIGCADLLAINSGVGGAGIWQIAAAQATAGKPDADADADADADEQTATDAAPTPAAPEAKPEGEDKDKAVADFIRDLKVGMVDGDFTRVRTTVADLIDRANKPAVIQTIATIDPSKIKGVVPVKIGTKDAKAMGVPFGVGAHITSTVLPVYNAPDAPAVDQHYIWPDCTVTILSQLRRGRTPFAYGPAGTGKTTLAKQIAAHLGRRFVRISCDDQTEAATLVGMTVPDGEQGTKWQDGQLAAAIRCPGTVILIDEPSVARPGAMFVLQAVLDDDRCLHIAETGEVIPVAPDVMFLLADNTNGTGDTSGAYEGTRVLNRATLDRCGVTVRLDYLSPDLEAKAITSRTGCTPKLAASLAKFATLTRRAADGGKVSHGLGIRRLMALAEAITDGTPADRAFQYACLETAPHDDREHLRQLWTAEIKSGAL